MTDNGHAQSIKRDRVVLSDSIWPVFRRAMVVGAISLVLALLASLYFTDGGLRRFYFAYLTNFMYFLSLALGGLIFVLLQHLGRAGWSVTVRRTGETMAATLPILAAAFAPIFIAVIAWDGQLYPWAQTVEAHHAVPAKTPHQPVPPEHRALETDEALAGSADMPGVDPHAAEADHADDVYIVKKRAFLNRPFFLARCVVYFGFWSLLALWLRRSSIRQDETGDPAITARMQRVAPLAAVFFMLTLTFAAFDLMMSLSPVWYSTIFGIYYFSGCAVAGFATLILLLKGLQRAGYLEHSVNAEHYQDLGKYLFAFVFFWGYIAFSQYMLIWYANLPETTFWFAARGATTSAADINGWTVVSVLLLFGHLLIPFPGLLSRHVKRNDKALAFWAIWMLVFHWVDVWWLIMPEMGPQVRLGLPELLTFLGIGGLFVAGLVRFGAAQRLVAVRDPRLPEALAFHNV